MIKLKKIIEGSGGLKDISFNMSGDKARYVNKAGNTWVSDYTGAGVWDKRNTALKIAKKMKGSVEEYLPNKFIVTSRWS